MYFDPNNGLDVKKMNICRCCFVDGCYKDISMDYYYSGEKEVYEDMLRDTLGIQISHEPPTGAISHRLICDNCILRLRDAFMFKKMVVCSEERFLQYLQSLQCEAKDSPPEYMIKIDTIKEESSPLIETDFIQCNVGNDSFGDDDIPPEPVIKIDTIKEEQSPLIETEFIKCDGGNDSFSDDDSLLPPCAELVAEEMPIHNQVYINSSNPVDVFEVTPTVENLYRNFSNISPDSDISTGSFNVQKVTSIVHNIQEKDNEKSLPPLQNPIPELSVSKPDNFSQDEIGRPTPMNSPSVSFSPTHEQAEVVFDVNSYHTNFSHVNSDYTDTPLSSPASEKKKSQKKKDACRLRDKERKYNLNRGLEYISRTGKTHKKKEMKSACKCPRKCFEIVEETARYKAFKNFWELGNHTLQWDFIAKYVSKLQKKRVVNENSQRNCTLRYSLPVAGHSSDIEKVYICKTMFLNTLSISYNFVKTALDKFDIGFGVIEEDRRGKHLNHPVKSVCSHVNMFQPIESHYTRKETSKINLDGH